MRIKQPVYVALILLLLCSFMLHEALTIRPGEGLGEFRLYQSSLKDIRTLMGKRKLTTMQWQAPACGMQYPYKVLNYPDEGMLFRFDPSLPNDTDKIVSIELYGTCKAMTKEGIGLYASRRADIYKAYGSPAINDTTTLLEYLHLGISFEFAPGKPKLSDPVKGICLFRPRTE